MLLLSEFRRRIYSRESYYGLYFELGRTIRVPDPPFPLHIRQLLFEDIKPLFFFNIASLSNREIKERLERLLFLRAETSRCFVASGPDLFPFAICWLLMPEDNPMLEDYFKGNLPSLECGEALLEFIYIHPAYRGLKLMEWISRKLFIMARSHGATRAIAYVRGRNEVSLKSSYGIGWRPFLEKMVIWKCFKRQTTYRIINRSAMTDKCHCRASQEKQ